MEDLTIIMMTPNRVPSAWAAYHRQMLEKAAAGAPIITVSAKPLDWGFNIPQEGYGLVNLYCCLLKASLVAETELIAVADDDTLYPPSHFAWRPKAPGYFYNLNRWHLLTWGDPFYFHKPRPGGGLLIATRELVIRAISNRFQRHQDGDLRSRMVKELGTRPSLRKMDLVEWEPFYTTDPVVSFYHTGSVDELCQRRRKRAWPVRAFDLPVWGRADNLRRKWR